MTVFVAWFDFSVFGCVHVHNQAFVKVTARVMALTLG